MRTDLFSSSHGARTGVSKVGVLLTDGNSTDHKETLREAKLAKEAGIRIVAIGIGPDVNDKELEAVASLPASENYVHAESFNDLKKKLSFLGKTVCKDQPDEWVELCDKPADVAFMFDSSVSIEKTEFEEEKKFVKELMNTFNVGPDTIHVSALKFSKDVVNEWYFNDVKTAQEASERIGQIEHARGSATNTHSALEVMRTDLFSSSHGARTGVSKVGVLLTDGNSTDHKETLREAKLAKEASIRIVAIGIGPDVNDKELEAVASSPASENYVHAESFDDLKKKLSFLGKTVCKDQPDEWVELCDKPADVAFMFDSSVSIEKTEFEEEKKFVKELMNTFNVGPDTIHVSALKFSKDVVNEWYFNDVKTAQEASERIGQIEHARGSATNTHSALEVMRTDLFSSSHGARTGVSKVGVLLTDGNSTDHKETLREAKLAKEAGIRIVAIGIGPDVNDKELEAVASSPASENYVHAESFDDLKKKLSFLGKTVCKVSYKG